MHNVVTRLLKRFSFLFLWVWFVPALNAQTKILEYNMYANNLQIGVLKAKKITEAGQTKIEISTEVDVDLVYRYHVLVTTYSKYSQNQLTEAYVKKVANRKVKEEALLKWMGENYVFKNLDKTFEIDTKIYFCTSRLYFEEPKSIKNCLAVSLGKIVNIQKIGERRYKIDFPDGTENVYEYNSEGICKLVIPGFKLLRLTFKLKI